jgi:DNA adenine methylase
MIAADIIDLMPKHKLFVDVFGGGAAVTIAKPYSDTEVYNDIGFVSTFFKVLRDNGEELYELLRNTPWSRQEFEEAVLDWNEQDSDIEKCRKWFIIINQGFTHQEECTSWLMSKGVNTASAWKNHVDSIPFIVERFRDIIIEHMSFEYVINQYDSKETLFYCDPPYMPNNHNGKGKGYVAEMTIEKHSELLNLLHGVLGQVIVSGYSSPLYDDELKGWRRKTITRKGQIANSTGTRKDRTECIWIKERSHGLWEGESIWSLDKIESSGNVPAISGQ